MSMYGAICAEEHIKVVRKAISEALAKATTEEAKKLLKQVLSECEMGIDE